MPKVSETYREAKRDEIVQAAMRAFHRKGFQGASMADIIAESGLSAGAIYGHFPGKADIILAVAERVVGARVIEVETLAATTPMPPPAALVRVVMNGMMNDVGRPAMIVQLWGQGVTEPALLGMSVRVMGQLRAVYADYISLWHQRQHGRPKAEADAIGEAQVALFLASAQGFIVQSALFDDFDRDRYLTSIEEYLPR
jgi:AcrR family transcriptional regulator